MYAYTNTSEPSSKRGPFGEREDRSREEVPLVRRPDRLMYVSVHSGRLGNRTSDALCRTGHEDKGLRGHRVPDLPVTTVTIGLTPFLGRNCSRASASRSRNSLASIGGRVVSVCHCARTSSFVGWFMPNRVHVENQGTITRWREAYGVAPRSTVLFYRAVSRRRR